MRSSIILVKLLSVSFLLAACNNKSATNTTSTEKEIKRRIEIIDPEALAILDTSKNIELIAEGFSWTMPIVYQR